MPKCVALLLVLLFTASCAATSSPVKAEPKTIVVPDSYPTIAFAIGNATQGDIIFVKKGIYEEHSLVIDKTVSLIGEDNAKTIIKNIDDISWEPNLNPFPPPLPVAIKISNNNVNISGFTITCEYGWWVPIEAVADRTQIVGNIINQSDGLSINGNHNIVSQNLFLPSSRNSFISCTGSYNAITSNTMSGRTSGGLNVKGSFNVVYSNNLTDCDLLGIISLSGEGNIVAKNYLTNSGGINIGGSNNTVFANIVLGAGFSLTGYNNTLYANNASDGVEMGSQTGDASYNTFFHNNFEGNTLITINAGVNGPNYFDNGEEGNFWSDYKGTDVDGDGIGNTPYVINNNWEDRYPLIAPFDIDSLSIELPEWASSEPQALEPEVSEPFPTAPVIAASVASAAIIGISLMVYFKKRRRFSEHSI